jgi:glycosyltransferase involved in cell wall biosynthesis
MRMKPAPRVLMIGTAPGGRGGVASVVEVLRRGGLFERESVRYLSSHREGSRSAKAVTAFDAFWRLGLACLNARPAVVHAHVASRASFARKSLLLLIARAAGCRTIFHLHGAEFDLYAGAESGPALRWWIRHTLERSSVVIALSDSWAAFLRGYAPAARIVVVPNSVPLPSPPEPGRTKEQPGRILFLGRVDAGKGVFELLEAVAALAPAFPQVRLVIGGVGELDRVRRRADELGIGERVSLPGWIDGADKQRELALAQVFCLPSHAEGLPMALLEAMAAAKAVVASTVGGIPEAVADGANGLLVAPGNAGALAGALATLLKDAALRVRLGDGARATVRERFSTEAALGQLSALYRELAEGCR